MRIIKEVGKIVSFALSGLMLYRVLIWVGHYPSVSVAEEYYTYVVIFVSWLILLFPVGELIGYYLERWRPPKYQQWQLKNAGKIIGRLERTMILIFYLAGSLEGIAFLVVAKTIYRFGSIQQGCEAENDSSNSQGATFSVSQYIILGSFLSYTVAMVGGVLIKLILGHLGLSL